MADVQTSNLYPPIIDTFMPAFTGSECKVYFEFSDFNTEEDILLNYGIQASVVNQKNNISSLAGRESGGTPAAVRLYTLEKDSNGYYITIQGTDLKDGFFHIDQFYKVQLRFISANLPETITNIDKPVPRLSWVNSNLNYFSEWSTVCLIRRISEPHIETTTFISLNPQSGYDIYSPMVRFGGKLVFSDPHETEYLSSYLLVLYKVNSPSSEEIVEESGILYNTKENYVNRIKYSFKHRLQPNYSYRVEIRITTNNLYEQTYVYENITYTPILVGNDFNFTVKVDEEQGRNKLTYVINDRTPGSEEQYWNYFIISRTSNKSNFKVYEDIYSNKITAASLGYEQIFYDESIESGVWYQYCMQLTNKNFGEIAENRPELAVSGIVDNPAWNGENGFVDPPYINNFEYMFLNSKNKQLKMQFDSRVTSYKRINSESKTETIGSPYPFVRRNSAVNYKQFSINGLISFHTDDANIFLTDEKLYGSIALPLYEQYNSENRINPYIDYNKEREFREKVIDFLTSGRVFLLRTMTEGNVLVRLMDINITPNQSLNNYICSFTATANEIGECTPDNYYKYGVFYHRPNLETKIIDGGL